jgi:1-acyl-sn-glycerol-3-phosphate acyltransferase
MNQCLHYFHQLSYCGMSAAACCEPDIGRIHTAAASVLLQTPILKNVMGIFGLVDASRSSLQKHFKKKGIDGCVVLYVGGIAELFKSCPTEERLFLSERKGFIKLALREGVDVVPAYLFGNTTVLSVLKHGPMADLSRKLQVSLTYIWGKWYLPIPRDEKVRKM